MGTASTTYTSLRQLLRSLCHNMQWKYAVFWKLKHRSRMLLTWEDGYCDYPQASDTVQHLSDNVYFNDMSRNISFDREIGTHDGSSAGYSIGLAVANMSCLMYALGEGAVGKVALTGKHSWVFAHEINSKLVPECPEDWHLQFAIGIKVMEDLKQVSLIKDLFNTLQNVADDSSLIALSGDFLGPSFSSPLLEAVSSDKSDNLLNPVKLETMMKKGLMVPDVGQITANKPSTIPQFSPHFAGQDSLQFSEKTMQHILDWHNTNGSVRETVYDMLSANLTELPYAQNQFMCADHLEYMPDFTCLQEELHFSSQCTDVNPQQSAKQSTMSNCCDKNLENNDHNINMNSSAGYDLCSFSQMADGKFEFVAAEISHEIARSFLSFPADSELHEALGPAFPERCLSNSTVAGDGCILSLIGQTNSTEDNGLSVEESGGWFAREHLLDAVVANAYGASEECAFDTFINIRSPSSLSEQLATSCQTLGDDLGPLSYVKSASAVRSGDVFTSSPTGSSSRATSILIDEVPPKIESEYARSRRGAKSYQVGKRKARAGGNGHKPRPRDRQMIQDRVKELREIVPNGSKCSIDALLDRTIKHMLFLRNVTNQAEKLKKCTHRKVGTNENWNIPAFKSLKNNASWAFELGSLPGVYPIIVENLDHPGHVLVEMLCEEHGLFLEIAQVIRHLELTILKGVMEKRSEKNWAHFIVEVSRGFQREDILWPMMQLLQHSRKPI